MTTTSLKFLSETKLAELRSGVGDNLHRYADGTFKDLERDNGWAVESRDVLVNIPLLATLEGTERTAEADVKNSLILYEALAGMTPALAREERVWVRLTHIECLAYSRARWLAGKSGEQLVNAVELHMFARGLTGVRDDNALARLWWNMYIATIAAPDEPRSALELFVQRADVRMQFVERSRTASRRPLAGAVVRAMRRQPWIVQSDKAFEDFMKVLNREAGGVLFEILDDAEIDELMDRYAQRSQGGTASAG